MKRNRGFIDAWIHLLEQVDKARVELRCSKSPAWFRGQADSSWKLLPSVFRYGTSEDPDDSGEIRRRLAEITKEKDKFRRLLRQKTSLKTTLATAKEEEKASVSKTYHEVKTATKSAQAIYKADEKSLSQFRILVNGERELFDEFLVRSGKQKERDSWSILAEMRHHGVPTRLLDWTDRLDIALYFALDKCREENAVYSKLPEPYIWVLNPYILSKRASQRTAIWNISQYEDLDYYQRLVRDRSWPFDEPLPIYPPYPIERIRSQRGHFVVFGNSKNAMEEQVSKGSKCLKKIKLDDAAAQSCIDYLTKVQNLTPFEVYRDLDALGKELEVSFSRVQGGTSNRVKKMTQQ